MQGGNNGNHNVASANLMRTKKELGGHRIEGDEYPFVPITAGIPDAEQKLMHVVEFHDLAVVARTDRMPKEIDDSDLDVYGKLERLGKRLEVGQ